jgi:F0F1-type ATP synthase assembly protein I
MTDESKDAKHAASTGPHSPSANPGARTPIAAAEFAGIGMQFAVTILVFALVGNWLDKRLGQSHWLLIIGVFAGAAAGFYSMYRKVTAAQKRSGELGGRR